jgi:hypothetical protein
MTGDILEVRSNAVGRLAPLGRIECVLDHRARCMASLGAVKKDVPADLHVRVVVDQDQRHIRNVNHAGKLLLHGRDEP